MLPFLKPRQAASVILERRRAQGDKQPTEQTEQQEHPQLMEAAEHIIHGTHEKDSARVAKGLRMAHEHMGMKNAAPEEKE